MFAGDKDDNPEPATNEVGPIIRIEATFAALYEIEAGEAFSDEDVSAFAALNTHLNVYPFWREFVHDALGRAGMAPFLLPPFNPFKSAMLRPKPALVPPAPAKGPTTP